MGTRRASISSVSVRPSSCHDVITCVGSRCSPSAWLTIQRFERAGPMRRPSKPAPSPQNAEPRPKSARPEPWSFRGVPQPTPTIRTMKLENEPGELAKCAGGYVIATASGAKAALVRELGADLVIDHTSERFEERVRDVDVVFDTVGGEVQRRSLLVLRRGGTLVGITSPPGPELAKGGGSDCHSARARAHGGSHGAPRGVARDGRTPRAGGWGVAVRGLAGGVHALREREGGGEDPDGAREGMALDAGASGARRSCARRRSGTPSGSSA